MSSLPTETAKVAVTSSITVFTVLGFLFDFLQVALALADVISDLLVCIEFKENDHTTFFALVVTTLTITSFVNGVLFLFRIGFMKTALRRGGEHRLLMVVPFAVIGLLLPPINYVITKFDMRSCMYDHAWEYSETDYWDRVANQLTEGNDNNTTNNNDENEENEKKKKTDEQQEDTTTKDENDDKENKKKKESAFQKRKKKNPASAAFKMFAEKVAPQQAVLGLLDKAVVERFMSFMLLNSMAVCESIPQIIIQLCAISIYQHVTNLQIISLTLSMFSVVCKAWQLSRSFSVSAFFAKIFFLAHDLFSMAFVFSVLLAVNTPRETTFFFLPEGHPAAFRINVVCNIWLMIKLINCAIWAVLGLWLWIFILFEDFRDRMKNYFKASVLIFIVGCVAAAPVLIIHEIIKLTWFIGLNTTQQPSPSEFPIAGIVHQFLHDGSGKTLYPAIDWKDSFLALSKVIKQELVKRREKVDDSLFLQLRNKFNTLMLDDDTFSRLSAVHFTRKAHNKKQVDDIVAAEREKQRIQNDEENHKEREERNKRRQEEKKRLLEEIKSKDYRTPFLTVPVIGAAKIHAEGFLGACLKTFNSFDRNNQNKYWEETGIDLRTEKEKDEDEKEINYEKDEDEEIKKKKNTINNTNNDDDDDGENLINRPLLSSSGDNDIGLYGSSSSINNNNNIDEYGQEETTIVDVTTPALHNHHHHHHHPKKVTDNFIMRARHTILVQGFLDKASLASARTLNDFRIRRTTSLHQNAPLNKWDTFTAHVRHHFDPFQEYSVSQFIFSSGSSKGIGKSWDDFVDFVTGDNVFEEPRPFMILITGITFFISSIVGLLFPIVYAALYFSHLSIMQQITWYSAMVSLFLSIVFSKSFWNYHVSCMFYKNNVGGYKVDRMYTFDAKAMMNVIDSYFSLPLSTLLSTCITSNRVKENDSVVIPEDAFQEHVMPFLVGKHVKLFGVIDDDFSKMQEEILKKMS